MLAVKRLEVEDCRQMERFGDGCAKVETLRIKGSGKVDLRTLVQFRGLKEVELDGPRPAVDLGNFKGMRALGRIELGRCPVSSPDVDLKSQARSLKVIGAAALKRNDLLMLSRRNAGVVVWNAREAFKDGKAVDLPDG